MNEYQEREVIAGLKALAERTRHAASSPHVAAAVMAEMDRRTALSMFPGRLLTIAAALLVAIGGALWTLHMTIHNAPPQQVELSGFVPLPFASALPDIETARIVRVSLAVPELPAYGIAIMPDVAAPVVEAELLVAQDGQPRAIRILNHSSTTTGSTP